MELWALIRIAYYFLILIGYILFGTMFFVGCWMYWKEKKG